MDKFVIEGKRKLSGEWAVTASKNSTLPIIAASILAEKGVTTLHDVSDLVDIRTACRVIRYLGGTADYDAKTRVLTIDAQDLKRHDVPYDLMRRMRASFLFLGGILGRFRKAKVSLPGGCVLGPRPVDLHLKAFESLGVKFREQHGYITGNGSKMNATTFCFDRPTHTGTENMMIGAARLPGRTTIINAATDPEIVDVADFLNAMGAKITGAGTQTIVVEGVKKLRAVEHRPIPDRLEAGTAMTAPMIAGGEVTVRNVRPDHLGSMIWKLDEMGAKLKVGKRDITVRSGRSIYPTKVITTPYPGFPTDLQPAIMTALCYGDGASLVRETVFSGRFAHAMELSRMGADIRISGEEAQIAGVPALRGATVMASDIRAGAALVLAALGAEGRSEVLRVYHIDRGHDHLEKNLAALGADIQREKN